ncbi:60S acidic ribosomal protein P2-like [Gigantopelta aegis]|uniref:60S acidic ribosomal protein P2-like n=1 Tax=Gigantopelta aegis TaxID=1735272 RepID=UPI001B88D62F|nr:60S acidic ribosomal protein P2-like [Gigantopelta aegis]
MRYVAAYILSVLGGKANPTADDIKTILGSVAVDVDEDRLMFVIRQLKGKNIAELIEEGAERLVTATLQGHTTPIQHVVVDGNKKENNGEVTPEDDDDINEAFFADIFG